VQRRFDIVRAWSVDGRSLQDLVAFLQHLHGLKIDLYLHQQVIDTTTPAGKAMFSPSANQACLSCATTMGRRSLSSISGRNPGR
jgi:DNA invertase Pin-like site-specific DNA recombinase